MTVISRAYEALNILKRNSRGLTAEEFSRELNLSVRTAYRYLQEIALQFPLVKDTDGLQRYRLMEKRTWME